MSNRVGQLFRRKIIGERGSVREWEGSWSFWKSGRRYGGCAPRASRRRPAASRRGALRGSKTARRARYRRPRPGRPPKMTLRDPPYHIFNWREFSSVSTATIASEDAFCSIFRDLQDLHSSRDLNLHFLQIFDNLFSKILTKIDDFLLKNAFFKAEI